jgi:hypothetical protein
MRAEHLDYLGHEDAPYVMKTNKKNWKKVEMELDELKNATPPAAAANTPLPSDDSSGSGK